MTLCRVVQCVCDDPVLCLSVCVCDDPVLCLSVCV